MSQITKRAIEQSLKNLLLKKPLTKITINDIAEDCGINRMTFYYHFKDIYDLVEWACLEDAKRALDNKKSHDTWQQGFLQIFEAVRENKPFVMNVYRCVHQEQVEKYLKPQVDNLVLEIIDEEIGTMTIREEDKAFIALFLCVHRRDAGLDQRGYEGGSEADCGSPGGSDERYDIQCLTTLQNLIISPVLIKNAAIYRPVIKVLSQDGFCLW